MKKTLCGILIGLLAISSLTACSGGGIGEKGISKEEYEQISRGMSQYGVEDIIGGGGEKVSEKEENHVYTYTYKYQGEKSGYALITYSADYSDGPFYKSPKVTAMEQHDLS